MTENEDQSTWVLELEAALLEGCDCRMIHAICKGKTIPSHLRAQVWQICLSVNDKGDTLSTWDGLYDMPEQHQLRNDCQQLIDKLGNDEEDKVSVLSDLESVITLYCKSRGLSYSSDNGWLSILEPLIALKLPRSELFNCFYALSTKYIPRECYKNGKVFHLFRLLLLYHDPELCSFLDTKKILSDTYALTWFQTLFAVSCHLEVIHAIWDVYLQLADPFLMVFMALVILVNAKEQIVAMTQDSRQEIIDFMCQFPSALEAEDIEDFCSLSQYYASRTPQSFRKDYQGPLFGNSNSNSLKEAVSQYLCLPVSVQELLQSSQPLESDCVRYFVVDCRPAEQYNAGHLPTALHLDATLMLQEPAEFATAVEALFAAQRQAIEAGSLAGGEHLCFMGSGREEEDQFVHMVVANFLQKHCQYVSLARGGYSALHDVLKDNVNEYLVGHNNKSCIVCNPQAEHATNGIENNEEFQNDLGFSLIGKLSSVVKSKSAIMKEKLTNYITNPGSIPADRHISHTDRVGKRYRNMAAPVFSIGDDESDESEQDNEAARERVNLEAWMKKSDVIETFPCQEISSTAYMYPSHLLVTQTHLYVLREISDRKGMVSIMHRRPLISIIKITSKKKHPEFITFKYGNNADLAVTEVDRFYIPNAGQATKVIKQQIMKILDSEKPQS